MIDKRVVMIMNGPAVVSAQLLGLVPKLYPSNMPQMLNKHLVISCSLSCGVRRPKSSKRKKGSAKCQSEATQTFRRDLFDDINKQGKSCTLNL